MTVTAFWDGLGLKHIASDVIYTTDTIKAGLITSSWTPNQDTDEFYSTPAANEISGTGYSAGGVTLASKTLTYDSATNELRFDAADPTWTTATITARYLVYYKSTGTNSTSPILGYVNFGADQSVTTGTFTVVLDATGALKITAA